MLRLATVVLAALLLLAPRAEAQPLGCSPELLRWAERCASARGVSLQVVACPSDSLAVLSASVDRGAALRVELAKGRPGFRTVGGYALSPIGEFPDWRAAPPALRDAFERVVACAQEPPPRQMRGGVVPAIPTLTEHSRGRVPWILVLAAVLALLRGRALPRAAWARGAALLLGSGAATLALRAALHPRAYFHQNGQGPLWIDHLLTGGHHPYGPGFSEVFGVIAALAPAAPERAVFAAQSALAATQPASAWWIARALGASPWVSAALSLAVALDPVLGRTARSEAYFATGASLFLLAAVAVTRSAQRAWGPVIAGLLLAQAVRVHPALWVPAALVPLAALLREGEPRARAIAGARALGIAGAVIALTSAPALLTVLRSDLAAHWLSMQSRGTSGGRALDLLPPTFWGAAAALGVLVVSVASFTTARWRAALPVALALGTLAAFFVTDNYTRSGSPPWVVAAYARTFLPLPLAALAALTTLAPRGRFAPALGVALAAALIALTNRPRAALTLLPTDALELQRAWSWRAQLPRGATVVSVSRAGRYVLSLPIHGAGGRDLHVVALDLAAPPPDLRAFGPNTYYYRASTCSAQPAAAWCSALERANSLRAIAVHTLPAIPSMAHLRYEPRLVRVGLYRVTD